MRRSQPADHDDYDPDFAMNLAYLFVFCFMLFMILTVESWITPAEIFNGVPLGKHEEFRNGTWVRYDGFEPVKDPIYMDQE